MTFGETDFFLWKRRKIDSSKKLIKTLCSWIFWTAEVYWILQKSWRRENGFREVIVWKSERQMMEMWVAQKKSCASLWMLATRSSKNVVQAAACIGIQRGKNYLFKWGSKGLWFESRREQGTPSCVEGNIPRNWRSTSHCMTYMGARSGCLSVYHNICTHTTEFFISKKPLAVLYSVTREQQAN